MQPASCLVKGKKKWLVRDGSQLMREGFDPHSGLVRVKNCPTSSLLRLARGGGQHLRVCMYILVTHKQHYYFPLSCTVCIHDYTVMLCWVLANSCLYDHSEIFFLCLAVVGAKTVQSGLAVPPAKDAIGAHLSLFLLL